MVGTTKPKKLKSGKRKIARVLLSPVKVTTTYPPGEATSKVEHGDLRPRSSQRQVTLYSSI
jgi:ribosomal protein S12